MKNYIKLTLVVIFIGSISYSQNNPSTVNCKDKTIERVRKHCVCKDIEQYVKDNYNVLSISPYAQTGLNRIYARFNISNQGQINNIQVKGFSPELEKEAIRSLMSFPDIIPAKNISENVLADETKDAYTIMIQFEVKNTITNL